MTDKINLDDFKFRSLRQYLAATAVNLIVLAQGVSQGWFGIALPQLLSEDTPLVSGPLNNVQVSWLGSILNLGSILGTLMFGSLTSYFGVKRSMEFLALPVTVFWFLIYFGDTFEWILLARFVSGLNLGGYQVTAVLFISEIANDNIRGRLSSFPGLYLSIGILLAYISFSFVDYEHIPCIFVFIPVFYVIWFICFIPNTPSYYLSNRDHLNKNGMEKADKSLKYYKNYKGKTELEIAVYNIELERLKSIADEFTQEKLQTSDFLNRKAIKGIFIGIGLSYFSQLTGSITIITYCVYICKKTGTTLDPYMSSIAIVLMMVAGNFCSTHIADKMGRKVLLNLSLLGCATAQTCLSCFSYMSTNGYNLSSYAWVPVVCLILIVFIACAGFLQVSRIATVENLPLKIRAPGLTICVCAHHLSSFGCLKSFPPLMETIDLHGCMMIFAVNCIVGMGFVTLFVQETKGQPLDIAQNEISSKDLVSEISEFHLDRRLSRRTSEICDRRLSRRSSDFIFTG